ncbi:hypothetical protein [Leifsonia aquatica]|uniref:hypothetical protein n=1 Tax=Leifsonia aquatica TaxID=144185 RepID=UPI000468FF8D|nr:hypothetical protein [Leifsonia aquatica]
MRKLTPEAEAAVELAGKKWLKHKTARETLEATIAKRVKTELESEMLAIRLEFATAAQAALDAGATKMALRRVSSKNPGTLEDYLLLLAPAETPETEAEAQAAAVDVQIEWIAGDLLIKLDPQQIAETDIDRLDPELWSGLYETFHRVEDDSWFIDPTPMVPAIHGVTQWLFADTANHDRVVAWVKANPKP